MRNSDPRMPDTRRKVDHPFGEFKRENKWTACQRFGTLGECRDPKGCADLACADKWAEANYEPKRPRPVPEHKPLIVTPVASKKRPGEVVAFVGRQLCFFERYAYQHFERHEAKPPRILADVPEIGKPIEVMATGVLYNKIVEVPGTNGRYDWNSVLAVLLMPITTQFRLVRHGGFECSGSMCSTTARAYHDDGEFGPWLTPGKCQIFEAGNVNSGRTWKQQYTPLRPGHVWVDRERYEAGHFPLKAIGVSRLEDTMYWHAVKK